MFQRSVMIEETLYREHTVVSIEHTIRNEMFMNTYVRVTSTAGTSSRDTRHELDFNTSLTFEEAEEIIKSLPFFKEYEDPYASVVNEQAEIIANQNETIENQSQIISEQNQTINDREAEIENQSQIIDEQNETISSQETEIANQSQLIDEITNIMSDEEAATVPHAYKEWQPDTYYIAGDRRRYDGKLYRCNQPHTSQSGQTPDIVPALWTEIALPGETPVWRQPTGAQDAYDKGDKVHYPTINDQIFESTYDGKNVWAPDVYGWSVVI